MKTSGKNPRAAAGRVSNSPWKHGAGMFGHRGAMGVLFLAVAVCSVFLLLACSSPQYRKRSFMGLSKGTREPVAEPAGLNPLGALHTCPRGISASQPGDRVLVSRPEYFTEDASLMILALREALAENPEGRETLDLQLSSGPIQSAEEAAREGTRCGALIVLWEQRDSQTLEMTLPNPARVPLKALVQKQLCEFGNHAEQVTILYLTIVGLTAMVNNDYRVAQFYLDSANRIDVDCLQLPLGWRAAPKTATPGIG